MKRGTPDHPKTMELAESLQAYLEQQGSALPFELCQTIAVGMLERLHHFTARYAPAGDIGKHSNLRIALAVGWKYDPAWLIDAMQQRKLIDELKLNGARLYVHDWHDHSDDAADKWLFEKHLTYANGALTRRGKKSRPSPDSVAPQSRQSESFPESESKSDPSSESGVATDQQLRDWLLWWNTLKACGLVAAAVNVDEPSQGSIAGWKRYQKSKALRGLLSDRDAIRREIEASGICREGWFEFGKLLGGKNREGALIAERLMTGGYRDFNKRQAVRSGSGQTHDPQAGERDQDHGKF